MKNTQLAIVLLTLTLTVFTVTLALADPPAAPRDKTTDATQYVVDDRTLVPLEALAPILRGHVQHDRKTRDITLTTKNGVVQLSLDTSKIRVKGTEVDLGAAVTLVDDRVMVPVGLVRVLLGVEVIHDRTAKALRLIPSDKPVPASARFAQVPAGELLLPDHRVIFVYDGSSHSLPATGLAQDQKDHAPHPDTNSDDQQGAGPSESSLMPPDLSLRAQQLWPGAELRPDGSVRLPDGRILEPAALEQALRCGGDQPCSPPPPRCAPGQPCSNEAQP